jgi:hypothetical protein
MAAWTDYERLSVPLDIPLGQRATLRAAFVSGASFLAAT